MTGQLTMNSDLRPSIGQALGTEKTLHCAGLRCMCWLLCKYVAHLWFCCDFGSLVDLKQQFSALKMSVTNNGRHALEFKTSNWILQCHEYV